MGTSLQDFIGHIVAASYNTMSASLYTTSIAAACMLYCLTGVLLFSSSVSSFRLVFPPFNNVDSLQSLARDSSLVPPYDVQPNINDNNDNSNSNENESRDARDVLPITQEDMKAIVPGAKNIHFCFLVHGFHGLSTDLSYFETIIKQWICVKRKKQAHRQTNPLQTEQRETVDNDDFVIIPEAPNDKYYGDIDRHKLHDVVVHSALCNERKTTDGVINGGDRLITEMRQVIDVEMKKRHPELELTIDDKPTATGDDAGLKASNKKLYNITISLVGNSMGGLYGRYAVAILIDRHCVEEVGPTKTDDHERDQKQRQIASSSWILDGKYKLRLRTFCTTASPHLGVSQHTWIRIPRIVELGIARCMGQSGRDLFRLNDLLYTMATDSIFLGPLASFRKRIAYANCYGTDFPVPVETAAFLSEKSTFPHHRSVEKCKIGKNKGGVVVAALSTSADAERCHHTEEYLDELHQMSVSLDKLGWKKVFIDLRKEMLSIELPRASWMRRRRLRSHSSTSYDGSSSSGIQSSNVANLQDLNEGVTIISKDIVNAIKLTHENDSNDNDRLSLRMPGGHNMIVAFSRGRFATFLNKGGRPVVDALAKELAHEICVWEDDV